MNHYKFGKKCHFNARSKTLGGSRKIPRPSMGKASSGRSPSSACECWYCRSDVCSNRAHPAGVESPPGHYRGFALGQQLLHPAIFPPPTYPERHLLLIPTPNPRAKNGCSTSASQGRSNRGRKTYINSTHNGSSCSLLGSAKAAPNWPAA